MKPINQTILTLIMAFVLISGFLGVYAVANKYENNDEILETIFISNSDLTPYKYNSSSYTYERQTGTYLKDVTTDSDVFYPSTMVYNGNNTWLTAHLGEPAGMDAAYMAQRIVHELPSLKNVLISKIEFSYSLPNTVQDLDCNYQIVSQSEYGNGDSTIGVGLRKYEYNPAIKDYWNVSYNYSLYETLRIYEYAQTSEIDFIVVSVNANIISEPLLANSVEYTMTLYGKSITTWSLQDSINAVIGASIGINAFVCIYMLDSVDFNVTRKDLKRKTTKRKTTKRKKGKR